MPIDSKRRWSAKASSASRVIPCRSRYGEHLALRPAWRWFPGRRQALSLSKALQIDSGGGSCGQRPSEWPEAQRGMWGLWEGEHGACVGGYFIQMSKIFVGPAAISRPIQP